MAINLTNLTANVNNIQALSDVPSEDGLTSTDLKAKFDKAGDDIKTYINGTLIPELETDLNNVYTKSEVYPKTDVYQKTEIDTIVSNLSAVATTSSNGMMSSTDKVSLDNLVTNFGNVLFHFGTVTKTLTTATSLILFTKAELETIFGKTIDTDKTVAIATNGDGILQNVHIDGTTWQEDKLYAVFDRAVTGSAKINYLIITKI